MLQKRFDAQTRDWLNDLALLALGLIIFYSLWLGSYPLFTPDEGRYSEIAREMVATGDYITPRVNGIAFLDKPVLYYWLQAAAIHLFGVNEWALRFFPMLLGVIGCLVSYVCGRLLFNKNTGRLAAIILATTPLYFACSHYADLDLEVAVFISCSLLFFITGVFREGKSRQYFLFAAYFAAACAFLTKGMIGIVFPIMIIGSWILLTGRWALLLRMNIITGLLLFAALTIPWYYFAQAANPQFLHYFFVTQQVSRFLSAGEFNNPIPFWFYIPIILIGFFPWTAFLFQSLNQFIRATWQNRLAHQKELYLLLWFAIVLVFFSIPHSKIIGYILPVFPPIALLTAKYLNDTWNNVTSRSVVIATLSFAFFGAALLTLTVVLLQYAIVDFEPNFATYLMGIAAILISSIVTAFIMIKKRDWAYLVTISVASSILLLLTLTAGATYLNQNTAKPLAMELKPLLRPTDQVILYFKYYQDVPLYLERPVTIVADWTDPQIPYRDNWVREMWYGMPFQNTDDRLIDENAFWQRFDSNERVFVFLNDNYFDQFKKRAKSFFILGKYNDIILLSNQPTFVSWFQKHYHYEV